MYLGYATLCNLHDTPVHPVAYLLFLSHVLKRLLLISYLCHFKYDQHSNFTNFYLSLFTKTLQLSNIYSCSLGAPNVLEFSLYFFENFFIVGPIFIILNKIYKNWCYLCTLAFLPANSKILNSVAFKTSVKILHYSGSKYCIPSFLRVCGSNQSQDFWK